MQNIDIGAEFVEGADALAANLRRDGHGRMMGIQLLDHRAQIVQRVPVGGIIALFQPFRFVAEAPDEHRRVIAVAIDDLADLLHLPANLHRISVVEPLRGLSEPEADSDGQTAGLGRVEVMLEIVGAPGADGIAAALGQQGERIGAASAFDHVRLAIAEELPAAGDLLQFGFDGLVGRLGGRSDGVGPAIRSKGDADEE